MVELEAGLAGEGQPHDVAVDPGHRQAPVLEEAGRLVEAQASRSSSAGAGPGDVDGAERHRAVEHMDPQPPRLDPVPYPHLGRRCSARGEGQGEAGVVVPADHPVVDDVAALVEHAARTRDRPGRRCRGRGSGTAAPAPPPRRARTPPSSRGCDTSPMLTARRTAQYSAPSVAVGPRAPPAAEAVQLRAQPVVLVVQRSAPERVDVVARRRPRPGSAGGPPVGR